MTNFHFIASNKFELEDLSNLEKFVDSFPEFQSVHLSSEKELILLLKLIGIENIREEEIDNSVFTKYWDLSQFKLPEYNEIEFDKFYENWIKISSRENNMDEYGSLIFLQELSKKWNNLKKRLVVKENY